MVLFEVNLPYGCRDTSYYIKFIHSLNHIYALQAYGQNQLFEACASGIFHDGNLSQLEGLFALLAACRDSVMAIKGSRHSPDTVVAKSPGPIKDKWQPSGTVTGHCWQSKRAPLVSAKQSKRIAC